MAKAKQVKTTEKAGAPGGDEAEVAETTSEEEAGSVPQDDSLPTGTRRHLPPE